MPSIRVKGIAAVAGLIVFGAAAAFGAAAWRAKSNDLQSTPPTLDWHRSHPTPDDRRSDVASGTSDPTVPVRVFLVGSVDPSIAATRLTGVVRARRELNLAFRVSGKILHRHVEVGQSVGKGELLFELDSEDFALQSRSSQAVLDVAEASLHRAVLDEKRASELRRSNAISPADYEKSLSERDVAIGQHQTAQKQLELASNQLSYCRLVADESGVITAIDAEAGQVVAAGSRVATLAQSDELEAVIDIPENRIPAHQDLAPIVRFWSLPSLAIQARLRELSPVADPLTRTFRGRFSLIDPPRDVRLGMTATVEWSNATTAQEVSIPAAAVFERDGKASVWLVDVEHGTIAARPVQISMVGDHEVIVSDGLARGERIVSAGVQKLDESLRVRIWESLP